MTDPEFMFYLDDEDEYLIVNKTLARAVGLNASMVLRCIHKWVKFNRRKNKPDETFRDGVWWTYNGYAQWQEIEFDFWSYDTIRRAFVELETLGLLHIGNYNERKGDRTKWYTVNYAAYRAFLRLWIDHKRPKAGNGHDSVAYAAFLEDWKSQQSAYTNIALCNEQYGIMPSAILQDAMTITNVNNKENTDKDSVPFVNGTATAMKKGKPKKQPTERKKVVRSETFCCIARESFQIFDVDALGKTEVILINKLVKWLRENSPGATITTLMEFYKWYDKAIRVSRPRDEGKFGLHFVAFRQQHLAVQAARSPEMDAQAKLKQLKADETRREREHIAQLSQKDSLDETA